MSDVLIVPATLALLPQYAGQVDPIAPLRAAIGAALATFVAETDGVVVLGDVRIGRQLLNQVGGTESPDGTGLLVVADGSARRGEKAPGHIDERAHAFDDVIEGALKAADLPVLADLDEALGAELLAAGTPTFKQLGSMPLTVNNTEMTYADDPFGVRYWVVRWS